MNFIFVHLHLAQIVLNPTIYLTEQDILLWDTDPWYCRHGIRDTLPLSLIICPSCLTVINHLLKLVPNSFFYEGRWLSGVTSYLQGMGSSPSPTLSVQFPCSSQLYWIPLTVQMHAVSVGVGGVMHIILWRPKFLHNMIKNLLVWPCGDIAWEKFYKNLWIQKTEMD